MATVSMFQNDVNRAYEQILPNCSCDREAKRIVSGLFGLTIKELESIIDSRNAWLESSNRPKPKHVKSVEQELFGGRI